MGVLSLNGLKSNIGNSVELLKTEPFISKEVSEQEVKDIQNLYQEKFGSNPFEEKDVIRVMLAEPSSGQIDIICEDNRKDFFLELGKLQSFSKFRFCTASVGRMLVGWARDALAEEALKQGIDWILFFDDDQTLPRGMFLDLAQHMSKADIIVPLICQRVAPFKPVYYSLNLTPLTDGRKELTTEHVLDYPLNSVFSPDAVGFGVVLLRTDILRKMPKPWFFSNTAIGEDIYFCYLAKQIGARIVADTRIKVGHLGHPTIITEEHFRNHNKKELLSENKS